jgi:hypothetical protein
VVVAATGAP